MDQTNKIANPINNLSYDKTSAISIFEYSKGLLGRSLREFIKENYSPKKGKGSIGQMVENLYFLLETNNNPEADFSSAGMELKCTPLKLGKNDTYLIKERLVCNMINYCEVVKEDFEQSHFYLKCQLMLLLFYLYRKNCDNLDLHLFSPFFGSSLKKICSLSSTTTRPYLKKSNVAKPIYCQKEILCISEHAEKVRKVTV